MSFFDIAKNVNNITVTEKGDLAYKSTMSACLDFFALAGGKRDDPYGAFTLFTDAFFEDPLKALKIMFFIRDARGGMGERNLFRVFFTFICLRYPKQAAKLIPLVLEYGRFDDILVALTTPVEKDVIELIKNQLEEDVKNKKEGKAISLLSKWLPSVNTSSSDMREVACYIANKLGMSKAEYRKTLSFLRKDMIVENFLREKRYADIDYSKLPSLASIKYKKAFNRNDTNRYNDYLYNVLEGKEKMNTGVMDATLIVRRYRDSIKKGVIPVDNFSEAALQKIIEEGEITKKTLVVRDGSGSMYQTINPMPIDVADAMTLITAGRLVGEFKDKFITFSNEAEIIDLSNHKTFADKLLTLYQHDDVGTTNIESVYNLIFDVYSHPGFNKKDALDQILIISDMQFDMGCEEIDESTFETFTRKFKEAGFKRPDIIYWNVASREKSVPVTKNELGVKLASGNSKNLIQTFTRTNGVDPEAFMNNVINDYAVIDEIFPKGFYN